MRGGTIANLNYRVQGFPSISGGDHGLILKPNKTMAIRSISVVETGTVDQFGSEPLNVPF